MNASEVRGSFATEFLVEVEAPVGGGAGRPQRVYVPMPDPIES